MSMKEKMHTGELYLPTDAEIAKEQLLCLNRLYDYNQTRPTEAALREQLLRELFAEIGATNFAKRKSGSFRTIKSAACRFAVQAAFFRLRMPGGKQRLTLFLIAVFFEQMRLVAPVVFDLYVRR